MPFRQRHSCFTSLSRKEKLNKSRKKKYYLTHVLTDSGIPTIRRMKGLG